MALILHNPGVQPLGQFDGYGTETLNFKGGEVASLRGMPYPAAGAQDVDNDGYVAETGLGNVIPAISADWTGMATQTTGPFFLVDDGTTGYGTLFGTVVGGSVGQTVTGGSVLGPHTATGSGKVTVWDKQGLYGVTLDALDTTNLTPTTSGLTVGMKLYFSATGKITNSAAHSAGTNGLSIGRLASFETNGSLVTTPQGFVAALNSPSGSVTSLKTLTMYQLVFWYGGAGGMGA